MNDQTKWVMGLVGFVFTILAGYYFTRTTTTLDQLVIDVAVIKSEVKAASGKDLPARVAALESAVADLKASQKAVQDSRWTRKDEHSAQERLDMRFDAVYQRFERNEGNIKANSDTVGEVVALLRQTSPADVLKEVQALRKEIAKSKEQE